MDSASDRLRPQPAVQRAGKPAVGRAALLRNLTDELRAQFGQSCRLRDHWSTAAMISFPDVERTVVHPTAANRVVR
ncbi:hypothetical protein SAMN05446935_9817 [Burkholderia sp. YR290]|nr:hypothetical protein SAMN05446935_9817 [Burkholderia sp. YR290]